MELVTTIARALGFSFAAGINLYATVVVLGLVSRYDLVALPPQFAIFDHDVVIAVALGMYAVEFLADKIPWVDSAWDAVHTLIRPLGGAFLAVTAMGEASPAAQGVAALAGGGVAASTHFAKAGTRAVVNASPEPFSNWGLSLGEDVFVVGLGLLASAFPLVALGVVLALLVLMACVAATIGRIARRRFSGSAPSTG
jgi:hypothetical protein